jgi:hypothetical protein
MTKDELEDIVIRLRAAHADFLQRGKGPSLWSQAADEIEGLRHDVTRLMEALNAEVNAHEPNGELQRLRAENEVLRTGFFQLADFADQQRQSVMGRLAENRSAPMSPYKIEVLEDTIGCYGQRYHAGEVVEYRPWPYPWQGMEEDQRVAQGLFVLCHGQGEFDVIKGRRVAENRTGKHE